MPDVDNPSEVIQVERLRLAAWLQLNGQPLLERRLRDDTKIIYTFKRSEEIADLVKQWDEKTAHEMALARYSRIVSFEIQMAIRMRRAAGLPTRFRAAENT